MIDCYCKACGLFISIPDEYAGGSGACPRCRTPLRIPRPFATDMPDYVSGQRYVAQLLSSATSEDIPSIITPDMGPSRKFKCSGCGQFFESICVEPHDPAQCPACKNSGGPIGQPVDFPRYLATKQQEESATSQPEEPQIKKDDMVDGYLVIQPIESDEMDVVIEGIAVDDNGDEINAAPPAEPAKENIAPSLCDTKMAEIQPEPQPEEIEASQPAEKRVSHPLSRSRSQSKPSQAIPNVQNVPDGQWVYFIKGKVVGPLETQAFRDMLSRGELSQSVLVWKAGMDSWQSADAFEELKVEVQTIAPGVISFRDDASTAAIKILFSRLRFLLWLAVILWVIVILMFMTRKTLEDLGIHAYFTCVIVMLSFSLAGLGMGVMLILKHIRSFIKSGGKAFVEWLSSMVAFSCAIAISFSVYSHFDPAPVFENVEQYQNISREGFDCLYSGNFNDTLNRVNWDEFVFNGRNVGGEFKAASSQKQKMLIIAEVMDQLREQVNTAPASAPASMPATQPESQPASRPATQPATQPAYMYPAVYNWMVIKQTIGDTMVMGRCRNGRRIYVTVRGGMITGISFNEFPRGLDKLSR